MADSIGFIRRRAGAVYLLLLLSVFSVQAEAGTISEKRRTLADNADRSGDITLRADDSGHFRGRLSINGRELPFLIDTGATLTVIPMKFAHEARLPFGRQVDTATAGGRTFDKLTVIDSLAIGNTELKHIEAALNQHLTEILLGMNTLRFFKMTQSGDTLTLRLNEQLIEQNHLEDRVAMPPPSDIDSRPQSDYYVSPNPITKSVECDAQKHCVTKFGN
ncbi:TIGR02281 family clan AA aspartic protease [Methylomonas koyamae]|uniref:Aspartyl protease n=1 Tax=Methylomonas koyamae TaxID=702114 RepID=A0AA91I340_9GAMM|nr:TIGR02281 family clan AA aspartic protease [Methylomonas koyamae]OAI21688.1 hypothetical protein A1356_02785 [Methylomonas koyamae]